MKKILFYTLLAGLFCCGQVPVVHAESPTDPPLRVIISEFQTGGSSDATEEFVELYNASDVTADVTGWQLQYRAASGTADQSWPASTTKVTIACSVGSPADCRVEIAPRARLVFTHTLANIAGAFPMSGGFSGAGGQIRLVQPGSLSVVHDFVGYGTAQHTEGAPASAPKGGASSKRIVDSEDLLVDTGNNASDFMVDCGNATPGQADTTHIPRASGCENTQSTTPSDPTDDPDPPASDEAKQEVVTLTYLPLIITEVLPDPVPPQQDSTDEFIEIYNPNDSAVTLKNYRLQAGSDYRYSFTLGDTPLGPRMYVAIPSAVSKLSLANSGSGVRLIDPSGDIAYEIQPYGQAKPGQSWMQDDTGWHWTLTVTPGAANILSVPPQKAAAVAAPKKNTTKKAATKAVAKPKAPKATKITAPKKTTEISKSPVSQVAASQNPQYWLLAPLGTLAAGYAAYEYRQDISRTARKGWEKLTGASGKTPPDA